MRINCGFNFFILQQLILPKASDRPSAEEIIQHRALCPFENKSKAQLRRELNAERLKNEFLSRRLQEAAQCLQSMAPNIKMKVNGCVGEIKSASRNLRLIGKKVNRSQSATDF